MADSENLKNISDASFEAEVLKSNKPCIVDFWAEWCGPCQMVAPIFEELSKEYKDRVNFYKMNVDENAQTPKKFSVSGIPTMILFKEGQVAEQIVGAHTKEHIAEIINKTL